MRARPLLSLCLLVWIAPALTEASEGVVAPIAAPEGGGDPLLDEARSRLPGCHGAVTRQHLEAAKGLHVAATHLYAEGRYDLALARWKEAYTFDCTAHRLLLNIATAHESLGSRRRAWEARALYVERSGEAADPEIAARVAADRPVPAHRPDRWRTGFSLEGVFWPTAADGATIGHVASGRLRHRSLLLELELPFAWWLGGSAIDGPRGVSVASVRASLGNPILSAHYVLHASDLLFRVGGRIGAPLASIDDVDWRAASARAAEAQAFARIGRWAAGRVPLSLGSGLDWRIAGPLSLQLEAEATALFPATEGHTPFERTRVDAAFEGRGGLEVAVPIASSLAVGGGAAAQVVWFPTVEGDDAQTAADVWALLRTERFVGRFGTLWALDGPLGWALEPSKVATVHLAVGVVVD